MIILMKLWVLTKFTNCEPNVILSVAKIVGTMMFSELMISECFAETLFSYITTKVALAEEVQERYSG